jgi:hypothetical protein
LHNACLIAKRCNQTVPQVLVQRQVVKAKIIFAAEDLEENNMKVIGLVLAAAACVIAAPAFAGSSTIANSPMEVAQVDVHVGDSDHGHDRVAMDHDHCRMTTIREHHDGRLVIRKEKHCD